MNLYHLIGSILVGGAVGAVFGAAFASASYGRFSWRAFIIGISIGVLAGLGFYLLLV